MDNADAISIAERLKALKDANKPKEVPSNTEDSAKPVAETPTEQAVPVVDEKAIASTTTTETSQSTPTGVEEEFQWDAGLEEVKPTASFDLGKLGSALNLTFNSEDEAISTVREKFAKLQTLESEAAKVYENVPTELKEAMEIAKKGGNWQEYVGNSFIDTTKLDPVDLFEQEYERQNAHRFKTPDGKYDQKALYDALDALDDGFVLMQGNYIKSRIVEAQNSKKQAIAAEAARAQETFVKNLGEAARELPTLFPVEKYGIKVEPKHVASLQEGIVSNKLIKKHLGDIDPSTLTKLDAKKLAQTLAKVEWLEGISTAQLKRGEVKAKKDILARTQNVQIENNGKPAQPDFDGDKKPLSNAEKMKAYVASTTSSNSL